MNKIIPFLVILPGIFLTSCQGYYGHMGGYHHMADHWNGGLIMWISIIILIGIIGFAAYFFFKKKDMFNSENPLNILKKRYARGEITKEEYEEMKKQIQ